MPFRRICEIITPSRWSLKSPSVEIFMVAIFCVNPDLDGTAASQGKDRFSANPLFSSLVINSFLSESTKKRTHPSSERCTRAYLFQKHSDLFKFDCEFKLLSKRLKT